MEKKPHLKEIFQSFGVDLDHASNNPLWKLEVLHMCNLIIAQEKTMLTTSYTTSLNFVPETKNLTLVKDFSNRQKRKSFSWIRMLTRN